MLEPGGTSGTISNPLTLQGRSWALKELRDSSKLHQQKRVPKQWLLGIYRVTVGHNFTGIRWIGRQ